MEQHFLLIYKGEDSEYKARRLSAVGISKESALEEAAIEVEYPTKEDEATSYYAIYQEASELTELPDEYKATMGYICNTGSSLPAWKFFGSERPPDLKNLFSFMMEKIASFEKQKAPSN